MSPILLFGIAVVLPLCITLLGSALIISRALTVASEQDRPTAQRRVKAKPHTGKKYDPKLHSTEALSQIERNLEEASRKSRPRPGR